MEIRPASIAQVQMGANGQLVEIDDDVLGIAKDLKQIDENLCLRWSEAGEYFVIYELTEDGNEHLVLTSQDLNPQMLERVRQISHSSYNYAEEIEKQDKEVERQRDYASSQRSGEAAERLAHAIRKDLGETDRIYIPKGIN